MANENKKLETSDLRHINGLVQVMEALLAPNGCPWDREQTPKSLTPYAIEEAHELAEAIERGDVEATKEELGDLLLQVVFHSALAKRLGQFDLPDVIHSICSKLIRRHPHVFGDVKVTGSEDVLKNWAIIKAEEKKEKKKTDKGFGIPESLPALQRAHKIGEKTKGLKFDWNNAGEVLKKVEEEFHELQEAHDSGDREHLAEELSDMFFVLAQYARHLKLEAETVARAGNRKFEDRFEKVLALAAQRYTQDFKDIPVNDKEKLWEEVKKTE